MGLGYLAFFAASGGFGNSSGLGAASGFDTLCCGSTSCLFGLAQSTPHGRVRVLCLMGSRNFRRVTCSGIGGGRGCFRISLGQECLFAYLLGSTMP